MGRNGKNLSRKVLDGKFYKINFEISHSSRSKSSLIQPQLRNGVSTRNNPYKLFFLFLARAQIC